MNAGAADAGNAGLPAEAAAERSRAGTRRVVLAGEADFAGFRRAARALVAEGVPPEQVSWRTSPDGGELDWSDGQSSPAPHDGADLGAAKPPGAADRAAAGGSLSATAPATATAPASATATATALAGASAPASAHAPGPAPAEAASPVRVPPAFVEACESAVLHRDPQRFALLYRLLWRLQHEPGLRHDALDADWVAVHALAQAVRRDLHKMKAFVRFRQVVGDVASTGTHGSGSPGAGGSESAVSATAHLGAGASAAPEPGAGAGDGTGADDRTGASDGTNAALDWNEKPAAPVTHIAWFEPEHHVVEAAAPFFAARFASLRWAILTPELSVCWDGAQLHFGPGTRREDAPPADAGEQLWLTYYAHVFNPARLKLATMQRHMPRRYWHNLPEAPLIEPLAAAAAPRSDAMLARAANEPSRRLPQAARTRVPQAAATRAPQAATARMQPPAAGTPRTPGAGENLIDGPAAPSREGEPTAAAEGWRTLAELREATDRCRECPIGEHATQSVFGEGPVDARLMLVGEQPGDQEDLGGRPFIGPAGKLLDRALADLGWPRERLYVTNAVKHFKFELRGKRRMHKTPGQREVAACNHWLQAEIERVRPQAMVALGATAARALLGRAVPVMSERGRWLAREDGLRVLVTLHPSALLRGDPAERDTAYAQWLDDLGKATGQVEAG